MKEKLGKNREYFCEKIQIKFILKNNLKIPGISYTKILTRFFNKRQEFF